MAEVDVNISYDSQFGSNGTGNSEFAYPTGICIANDNIYVVDRQNHRIQYFDLDGVYVGQFGSVGSGNDEFFFPEDITSDGTSLYIVDGSNHRVKVHGLTGTYISQYGSQGSADSEFDYPTGIHYNGGYLYIADTQNHRIKQYNTSNVFIKKFGSYGITNSLLNFPESITYFDGKLFICDSGNKEVKAFDLNGNYLSKINYTFGYPSYVSNNNDSLITVSDKTNNKIISFDSNGDYISEFGSVGSGTIQVYFPEASVYNDDLLYLVDSGNHRIKILSFEIETEIPIYVDDILKLTKQLYPTGRAWWLNYQNTFYKFHEGLSYSESRAYSAANKILSSIIPDNDIFDEDDASNWERALGLFVQTSLLLADRKAAILRRMQHPGIIKARQHYLYLQGQLQDAGFDVYVNENRISNGDGTYSIYNPIPSIHGEFNHGDNVHGNSGVSDYTKIANYIDEDSDSSFDFGDETSLRATIFIGGENIGDRANVDILRKKEFRELILKIKPAQIAGFLLIDYV